MGFSGSPDRRVSTYSTSHHHAILLTSISPRYVAQEFLAPKALAFVKKSLGSTYNETLGAAAPWADTVRHTKGYTWSAPFHFVDANDSPLDGSCSVDETRDCGDGKCILSAIANYTTRVAKTSLSAKQRQEALKFLGAFNVHLWLLDAKASL